MASLYGAIGEYISGEEEWEQYIERLMCYFEANDIPVGKQRAIFLSVVGAKTYNIVRSLSQNKPTQKTFAELVELMKTHLHPAPNEIAERFRFNSRVRKETESISQYVMALRKLSEHCNFADKVNEHIRDRLVCGVRNEKVQQRLLSEKGLTLERALEIATSMEAAARYTKEIMGGRVVENVASVNMQRAERVPFERAPFERVPFERVPYERKECYRCGSTSHLADTCPFKNKDCFNCLKRGHTRRKCRQNERREKEDKAIKNLDRVVESKSEVESRNREEMHEGIKMMHLYSLGNRKSPPISIEMVIGGKKVEMEVDTGATVTVMGLAKCRELGLPLKDLKETMVRLKTYTGEVVKPEGVLNVVVKYEGQVETLPLVVVKGEVPALLGRNWLMKIRLNWGELFQVTVEGKAKPMVEKLLHKYAEVFSEGMWCLNNFVVSIPVN